MDAVGGNRCFVKPFKTVCYLKSTRLKGRDDIMVVFQKLKLRNDNNLKYFTQAALRLSHLWCFVSLHWHTTLTKY